MAAPRPKSRDLGAALAGLVLGGSVIFLVMLMIVWLTNSHFEGIKKKGGHGPPSQVQTPGVIPSTTGTGSQAPVAPTATQGGSPTGMTTRTETVPSAGAPDVRVPAAAPVPQAPPPTKR